MSLFSILIPTYNRKEKLKVVLEALAKQKRIAEGEVIVGVDGSTDGTMEFLEGLAQSGRELQNLSFFRIENSGRSVIRNRLLDRAQGDIVIYIQDDIVVSDDWLDAHLDAQQQQQGAQVGYVTWYEQEKVSDYMKWLENGGHMLDFANLKAGQPLDYWHFYMGNISFPRDLVADIRFDEELTTYGWEDIVYGYQFISKGYKVYYNPQAKAYHWDEYLEEDLKEYMQKLAISAVQVAKKYPDIAVVPPVWKKVIFKIMILFGALFRSVLPQHWRWYLDMKKWFLDECSKQSA